MGKADGGDIGRIAIIADMSEEVWREPRHHPPVDDVDRVPVAGDKPDPHAQWDEAAGRWEIWSDEAGGWVSFTDGTVQAPGTPSVDPPDDDTAHQPSSGA